MKICFLSYRSDPYCGGQGVYIRNLTRSIKDLGHDVDVISGPPRLILDSDIPIYRLPSLDLYNPENLFRVPTLRELVNPVNLLEWLGVSTMGFPEPFVFGIRAEKFLRNRLNQYDIIHDNQSLSYGVLNISKKIPTVVTVHHPITKDRDIAINSVNSIFEKLKYLRWYSFISMQKRVLKSIPRIITVSKCSKKDISKEFLIKDERLRVVPNGVDTNIFHPISYIKRQKGRIIVTTSSDTPLKGLKYLLKAIVHLSSTYKVSLFVVGVPQKGGNIIKYIHQLGIDHLVKFTGRITDRELNLHYAKASIAVIPSIYEGFGLPAGEAMACGVPVVSSNAGGLPEVVGNAGILVPPKDFLQLSNAIAMLLDNSILASEISELGFIRIKKKFTWAKAANKIVKIYEEVLS